MISLKGNAPLKESPSLGPSDIGDVEKGLIGVEVLTCRADDTLGLVEDDTVNANAAFPLSAFWATVEQIAIIRDASKNEEKQKELVR